MEIQDQLLQIKNSIVSAFEANLVCILQYGSSTHNDPCTSAVDIDLLIILKEKSNIEHDLQFLRNLNTKYSELHLDIQLQYLDELADSEHFSLDAHGSFFAEMLKTAQVLHGSNPFLELGFPSNCDVSILNQVQNYVFRARQMAMGMEKVYKDTNPHYHLKKIKNIMNDLLLFEHQTTEKSVEKTLNAFQRYFKHYSEEETNRLLELKSNDVQDYTFYYESLYKLCLKIAKNSTTKPSKVNKFRANDIISEICIASIETKKCIVLLEGLPSVPYKKKLMQQFVLDGFNVVFPRYAGTWESAGSFLANSPASEIDSLLSAISTGIVCGKNTYVFDEFYIISTSFGGAVALNLKNKNIKKSVYLSPVTDFLSIKEHLATLGEFLKNMFPGAYRFDDKNMEELLSGNILTNNDLQLSNTKDLIVGGILDDIITAEALERFSQTHGLRLVKFDKLSHLNLTGVEENTQIYREIINFFKSKV